LFLSCFVLLPVILSEAPNSLRPAPGRNNQFNRESKDLRFALAFALYLRVCICVFDFAFALAFALPLSSWAKHRNRCASFWAQQ
jgi:hypothetical protein